MMRSLLIHLAFVFVAQACLAAEKNHAVPFDSDLWQSSPKNWVIEAKLEKAEYQVGKSVALLCTMRNATQTPERLVSVYPFVDYAVEVRKADGAAVPHTGLVAELRGPAVMYTIRSPQIEPGAEWKSTLDLSEYFQLTEPGQYTVFVRRYYSLRAMWSRGKDVPIEQSSEAKPIVFILTR